MKSVFILLLGFVSVNGHGRMVLPAGRSTAWRYGWNTPINYDDTQLFCGGVQAQIQAGYKCGVCGDPWDLTRNPNGIRQNEAGGRYATGTIVAHYKKGQWIDVQVDITANHGGWISFKICPVNDKTVKATHECLDRNPLPFQGGSFHHPVDYTAGRKMTIRAKVKLPANLVCDQCVLQWRYHTGNSWGCDPDRSCGMGKGNQEEFYACSDVKISENGGPAPTPSTQSTTTTTGTTTTPVQVTHTGSCSRYIASGAWTGDASMDNWCNNNCPSNCPSDICKCAN